VSTLDDGLFNIKLSDEFDYCIIHQISNGRTHDYLNYFDSNLKRAGVRYFQILSKGLSISRNTFFDFSKGKYLWIMDDDVSILPGAYNILSRLVSMHNDAKLLVLNYSTCDLINHSTYLESNSIITQKKNRFHLFNISSINMLIHRDVVNAGVRFDERFGLGTNLPSGEEFIFSYNVLDKVGSVIQTNVVVSKHPPITSGMDFYSTKAKVRAKKFMFINTFGFFVGHLLFLAFIFKKLPTLIRTRSLLRYFKVFFERCGSL
jgi:glycosyltransferase involved in cell wall biosynthesis